MDILLVAERLAKTDVTKTLVKILNKKTVQKFITDLNTKVQLFDYGEDSRGVELMGVGGGYAPSTISIKAKKGQPTNRVTLKDTGEFYKTFDVVVNKDASFRIEADTTKGGQNLEDRWGEDIVGLQQENVVLVLDRLRDEFYKAIYR
jgi:hypothetical protein|tara:strand:- start:112 stop:552 length:441 start_codon:yes stop_codon:yes gene_type:complete